MFPNKEESSSFARRVAFDEESRPKFPANCKQVSRLELDQESITRIEQQRDVRKERRQGVKVEPTGERINDRGWRREQRELHQQRQLMPILKGPDEAFDTRESRRSFGNGRQHNNGQVFGSELAVR